MKTQDPSKCPDCDGPLPILYSVSWFADYQVSGEYRSITSDNLTLERMLDYIVNLAPVYNNDKFEYFSRPVFIRYKVGHCAFCNKLASLEASQIVISPSPVPVVWSQEQFYIAEKNDELQLHASDSDDTLQARIEALREADIINERQKQSIRIRIQTDIEELESRGKKARKSRSVADASYISVTPSTGLIKIGPNRTKMEKTKEAISALGIDFNKFMLNLSKLPDISKK